MKAFEYVRATSAAGALPHLSARREDGVHVKGAGIDLLDLAKERVLEPRRLVSLDASDLARIDVDRDAYRIGAAVTLADLAAHDACRADLPGLVSAALEAATPQIRNRATVAGNLCQRPRCWYFRNAVFADCAKRGGRTCYALEGENAYHAIFDVRPCPIVHPSNLAPALLALGARAHVVGPAGPRTIPLEEFFVPPSRDLSREHVLASDEILTVVEVPAAGRKNVYGEVRAKQSFDFPLVSAAASARVEGGRLHDLVVWLGAVAPTPRRAKEAEEVAGGQATTPELAAKAAAAAFAPATPLARNAYKVEVGKALLADLLVKLGGDR